MRTIQQFHGVDGILSRLSAVWHTHSGALSYFTLYKIDMPTWQGEPFMTLAMCGGNASDPPQYQVHRFKSHIFQMLYRFF